MKIILRDNKKETNVNKNKTCEIKRTLPFSEYKNCFCKFRRKLLNVYSNS